MDCGWACLIASSQLDPALVPEAPIGLIKTDRTRTRKRKDRRGWVYSGVRVYYSKALTGAAHRLRRRPPQEEARSPFGSLAFLLAVTVGEDGKELITSGDWKGMHHSPSCGASAEISNVEQETLAISGPKKL